MTLSIRLPEATEKRLEALARETGQSKEFHIHQFIARGLEEQEDYALAADISDRVGKGEEAVYSLAEVRKDFGMDD